MAEYAHPEVLGPTAWVAEHTNDPKLRIVEVDVDTSAYDQGHSPAATSPEARVPPSRTPHPVPSGNVGWVWVRTIHAGPGCSRRGGGKRGRNAARNSPADPTCRGHTGARGQAHQPPPMRSSSS